MKLLICSSVLLASLLTALPFAGETGAPVGPQVAPGGAVAVAPASDEARGTPGVTGTVATPGAPVPEGESLIFEVTGNAKVIHLEGGPVAGKKPFKNKVNTKTAAACIMGNGAGCTDGVTLSVDPGGKLYLFFDTLTQWRLSTHTDASDATVLTGLIDGKGGFVMAGTDDISNSSIVLTGKVKFEKKSLVPKKISGKFTAVSVDQAHYGSGKFKATLADV